MDHHHSLEAYSNTFYTKIRHQFWQGKWMWLAAVILFLLSFGLWQWFGMTLVQIRTTDTESRKVMLPDQSGVLLGASTTLKYRKHFLESAQREVWLKGEASFSVIHREADADHHLQPFIVHTTLLDLEVTGTSFQVVAHRHNTRVVLNTGRINIHFKDKKLADRLLQPGEMLEYTGEGKPVIQRASR